MKTGLGLYHKYRFLISVVNLCRFNIRKYFIGFDYANLFLQRVDKRSLLLILIRNGASIGESCDVESGLIFHNCSNYRNLYIGDNCHIGKNCFFDLRDKIIIKNNVVISMHCTFITHLDMSKSELSKLYFSSSKNIIINNNCYLGVNSTLLMGVELGESSLIAANSLVERNVKTCTIVGGIPAKLIKKLKI